MIPQINLISMNLPSMISLVWNTWYQVTFFLLEINFLHFGANWSILWSIRDHVQVLSLILLFCKRIVFGNAHFARRHWCRWRRECAHDWSRGCRMFSTRLVGALLFLGEGSIGVFDIAACSRHPLFCQERLGFCWWSRNVQAILNFEQSCRRNGLRARSYGRGEGRMGRLECVEGDACSRMHLHDAKIGWWIHPDPDCITH